MKSCVPWQCRRRSDGIRCRRARFRTGLPFHQALARRAQRGLCAWRHRRNRGRADRLTPRRRRVAVFRSRRDHEHHLPGRRAPRQWRSGRLDRGCRGNHRRFRLTASRLRGIARPRRTSGRSLHRNQDIMNGLHNIRAMASTLSLALLWLNAILVTARALWGTEASVALLVAGALALAGSSTALWYVDRTGPQTSSAIGVAQAGLVALLVYGFSGSPLQIDMHMYFFAVLAAMAFWIDWRPLLAFTATTAVHHLVLYVVLPQAVFPGESNLSRVVLHAVILLLEAGILVQMTRLMQRSMKDAATALAQSDAARGEAMASNKRAEESHHAAEAERRAREQAREQEAATVRAVVDELASGLNALAGGDLTVTIAKPFPGDLDRLRADFNAAMARLQEAMGHIHDNASTIRNVSGEIRSAADDLSRRTEQQAASVEQTAAAVEQVSASVRESAVRAEEAGALVSRTKTSAEKSGAVVRDAVSAMREIEASSHQIGTIIGMIDEIAFQTNLLAL
ncbi:MAG: hypothetical protein KDJ74_03360, partial [Notoacmeibacter sp.]|nr:hypothetical protein [Notoacmeibacter sp.]